MILVIGCGFLGSYIAQYALENTDETVVATIRDLNNLPRVDGVQFEKCDVTNVDDIKALYEKTKQHNLTVFYLAACHNVDYVYENPDEARKVNCIALENFLDTMTNVKKLFFASTDCVYGENGEIPLLKESSPLNPVNEYGRQKIEAEKMVLSKGFTVTRLPFMFGSSMSAKSSFYDNLCKRLENGEEIEMIDGMLRSVLRYSEAAELLVKLSEKDNLPQIINVCGSESLSKYDVGCLVAQEMGAEVNLVKKISEAQGSKFFKDTRASVSVMDNGLLKSLLK